MVVLYSARYNSVRIYKTLRVTPAMAAGHTDRFWDMADIAALIDTRAEAPRPLQGAGYLRFLNPLP